MAYDPYMQALLAGANTDQPDEEFQTQEVPCTIHTPHMGQFVVKDVNAWGYMAHGVFATGQWAWITGGPDATVLIPYNSISAVEFNFEALERFRAEQAEAVA
jgi:hypothetical protein